MPDKWFSFAEGEFYNGSEPAFFNIDSKPWKKLLEDNYDVILHELEEIIQNDKNSIIPYYNQTLASKATSWTIFPLMSWGKKNNSNFEKAKKTASIISQIPHTTSCLFSILKPHTTIRPHFGDCNVMYRCHLTLRSNAQLPDMGMRVKGEVTGWETGKLFAFCDAHKHEVWNNTDTERWILIIDILREDFEKEEKKINSLVNATLWWQLKFQDFYFIKHLPRVARKWLMHFTSLFM